MKAYVADTLCSQLLMIKIAIYLFAQDQIASYYINVCTYVQVYPSCIVCVQPCSRGESHRAEQGEMALCRCFKSYSRSISFTAATQPSICHYSPACTYAYIMQSIVYMCVHRKCQHSAEAIHRIITGKIIINYSYIIQWNLGQPELGACLA